MPTLDFKYSFCQATSTSILAQPQEKLHSLSYKSQKPPILPSKRHSSFSPKQRTTPHAPIVLLRVQGIDKQQQRNFRSQISELNCGILTIRCGPHAARIECHSRSLRASCLPKHRLETSRTLPLTSPSFAEDQINCNINIHTHEDMNPLDNKKNPATTNFSISWPKTLCLHHKASQIPQTFA
jgi:hypothetical protein